MRSNMPYTLFAVLTALALAGCGRPPSGMQAAPGAFTDAGGGGLPTGSPTLAQVMRGRELVVNRDCGACHGGNPNPAAADWLRGSPAEEPYERIGPFAVWAANLTPDPETGVGRYTARQIFNALRYGLRPSATPDVEITSAVPGEGNHPARPNYLAPAMPWLQWRFMTDQELWDIAAYLKHGVRPVRNDHPPSQSPPDHWASVFTPEQIGSHVLPPFHTAHETPGPPERREQILLGRHLVASAACAGCHGGARNPSDAGWAAGAGRGAPTDSFAITIPAPAGGTVTYVTRPRNLTPDNTTGMGRFTERQIFNALRYGLRPGETPDVEITSTTPGEGNFPLHPKYLAPPMPWPAWRHMPDEALWAIAAYLKEGVLPVRNRVLDSEGPPDFWAGLYTPEVMGAFPAPPFPTERELYRP